MARCFNRNTASYKKLLDVHGDPITVDLLINDYQKTFSSEEIPSVEAIDMMLQGDDIMFSLRKSSLANALYRNLANKQLISKYKNKWYVNVTVPGVKEGSRLHLGQNVNKLKNYVKLHRLGHAVSLKRTLNTYEVIVDENLFTAKDVIPIRDNNENTRIPELVNHLTNIFPEVNVRYMTPGEAKKAYDQLPSYAKKKKVNFGDVKSFYWNGNAVLIKGRVTAETAVEEVLHPFVNALYTSNKSVFNNLLTESRKTFPELSQQIEAAYSGKKTFSTKDRQQELVTQALSRHFNKEYESTPSKPWYSALKEFLKFFSDLIRTAYRDYFGGTLKLNVGFISSETTMSDIAKMLNTTEFEFRLDLFETGDRKVQYSLSDAKQNLIDTIYNQAETQAQIDIVDKLLHQRQEVQDIFDSLGVSRAIINNETQDIVDLDTGETYESIENKVYGNKPLDDNYFHIIEGIINQDESVIESELRSEIKAIAARLDGMREDGSVIVPGVILADSANNIATVATALKIKPDGSITLIDVRQKADFTIANHATFMNAQRKILENLGYTVNDRSFLIILEEGSFEYDRTHTYRDSENMSAVEELVPTDVDIENKEIIDSIVNRERSVEGDNPVEDIDIEKEPEFLDSPTYDSIFGALKPFRKTLINREKGLRQARNIASMDKSRKEIIEEVQLTRMIVEEMYENPGEIRRIYTDVIRDVLRQINEFKEYATNPDNFGKQEFISRILNWQKYVENFRGLVNLTDSSGLNKTELQLKTRLQEQLNDLVGVRKADGNVMQKGIFDIAIKDHVRAIIKSKSKRNFTSAQLEELLTTARDINMAEYQTGDMATSRDTILALMDKIYKRDRQRVLDKIEQRAPRIRAAALKLARISGKKNIDYSFMLDFDSEGNFTGRYVTKIGRKYREIQKEKRSKLFDKNGWKNFISIENIEDATPQQLEYNKQLARDKQEYRDFMRAEIRTENGVEDGEFHRYTDEFKQARNKHEVYIYNKFSDRGYWVKRNDVTNKQYRRYIHTYFNYTDQYERSVNNKDGEPTGLTEVVEGIPVVKREFTEIRETSSTGVQLTDPKWDKLQRPVTELEKAQSEYYKMFIDIYEGELLEKLPENVKMQGLVPVIEGDTSKKFKNKGNLLAQMWTGMKKWGSDLIHPTTRVKKVFTDENGSIINNSLPLYYVGSAKDQADYSNLITELDKLKEQSANAESQEVKDQIDNQIKLLRGKIKAIENSPTKTSLSMDMTDSLLKFSAMAENYETMAQAEDTHLAMIKVLESRTYTNSRGDVKVVNEDGTKTDAVDNIGKEARMVQRAKKWMKMVYYNNDNDIKTFWDKLTKGIISYTSLAYVGTNVFGNINNYFFGRMSNSIETLGQRFYTRKAMGKAILGFNQFISSDLMMHLGQKAVEGDKRLRKYKEKIPYSKFGAAVAYFRMMDKKADLRESGDVSALWDRWTSWVYTLQDSGEYAVQTKIGISILHSTTAVNESTGAEMSLYDALQYDRTTGDFKIKDGFTKIRMYNEDKLMDWNDDARYEIRNYIRETNKQIHGNYAYEDRMVMQSNSLGQLAAQFHKWVAPAVKARFRAEYFDENLGWMEGRYRTFWNFLGYSYKNLANIQTLGADYKAFHGEKGEQKLQNVHRVMGEIAIMYGVYLMKDLLMAMWGIGTDDDDSDDPFSTSSHDKVNEELTPMQKRGRNILLYQLDRLYSESVLWVPIPGLGGLQQLGHFIKNPIASSRTLGEVGEAIEMTARTGVTWAITNEEDFWTDNDIVYERGIRAGELKLGKEWGDAAPFLGTVNKWRNFIQQDDFYIK